MHTHTEFLSQTRKKKKKKHNVRNLNNLQIVSFLNTELGLESDRKDLGLELLGWGALVKQKGLKDIF